MLRIPAKGGAATFGLLLLALGAVAAARAEDGASFAAQLTIGSDFAFRGVSQTVGGPVLQGSVSVEWPPGFYAYVWTSNVDFAPDGQPDDGARLEVDAAIGYSAALSERLLADVAYVAYRSPGTHAGVDYDYDELIASLWLDDTYVAKLAYSTDVFGTGGAGHLQELGVRVELPGATELSAGIGRYDLTAALGGSYTFTRFSLSRPFGPAVATLGYCDTGGDADDLFYPEAAGNRAYVSLDFGF